MITILGGGVAGAALARALALGGRRDVVVVDPCPFGTGSTGKALGGFRVQHGSALNISLSLASRPYFAARADRIEFASVGYLYLADTAVAGAELAARAELQAAHGLPIQHPDPRTLFPEVVADDLFGTNYCAWDGVYLPAKVLACAREEATAAGASFRYETNASREDLAAEQVVICAGSWSRQVAASLGVDLGVTPLERGVFQVGPFEWLKPQTPVLLEAGSGYHCRERQGRLLVIGPGDPNAWEHHRQWLERRLPAAAAEQPEDHWTGLYEMTKDHHPLVGSTEREGIWAMCGFSGHGVMHSPAVAESLAAMLLGDTPPLDLTPLSPLRTEALLDRTQL
ncbi:MAG: NAD(P)/FAD-dependent oxidoreductase [Candidatus Dormibacter sp.]|uniref:NAD(P)/FAD-dependent oxidoreductase n=1 Tax=Candidatus Dormibacter sp. TaxID=2973982 RepID=UPI000DB771C5|nr:MAG: hypothetical protein DLM66_08945 [Candidatus Dormibacteraeota bacterium]